MRPLLPRPSALVLLLVLAGCAAPPPARPQAPAGPQPTPAGVLRGSWMAQVVGECDHLQLVMQDVGQELESWLRTLGTARDAAAFEAVAAGAEAAVRRLHAERPAESALRIRWADATRQGEHLAAALRSLVSARASGNETVLPKLLRDLRRATGGYRLAVAQMEQRCEGARLWQCDRQRASGRVSPDCEGRPAPVR